jgi:polysaccharide biosynthesis/export protein
MWLLLAAVSAGMLVAPPGPRAGELPDPQETSRPPIVNLNRVSDDYRVGPGDILAIQVIEHRDLNHSLRVSQAGEISVPMVGAVRVAGKSTFEIEDLLARLLNEKGFVLQAEVVVGVTQYQSKPVYVWGAVANPGEFIMTQDLSVVDAILLAGGLQFHAADEALVYRRPVGAQSPAATAAPGEGSEVVTVDLKPLKEGRFPDGTLRLQPGDVLTVPEQRLNPFYVVGDVLDPRNFFYAPGKTLTASQAISWAQGPGPSAKLSKGILVRFDEQGRRQEIKVDYAAILSGRQEDFTIQPHDIIFIPGSKIKSITTGMVRIADNMAMYGAFRVGRTYQLPGPGDRPVAGGADRQE